MIQRQGLTLSEIMVAGTLAFLVSLMVFYCIVPSFRIVGESQIRTELQQQGGLALQQLAADLQNSVPTGISLALPINPGEAMLVATHPLESVLSTGTISFQSRLHITWHNPTLRRILRKRYSNPDPSGVVLSFQPFTALQTSRGNLELICASSNNSERSQALNVESFRVEKEFTSGGEVFACRILLQKPVPGKINPAIIELFRKVMLRNHL